jgi:hypothetical protein
MQRNSRLLTIMKHARVEKVALSQRFYPLFYPLAKIFRHYLSVREIKQNSAIYLALSVSDQVGIK